MRALDAPLGARARVKKEEALRLEKGRCPLLRWLWGQQTRWESKIIIWASYRAVLQSWAGPRWIKACTFGSKPEAKTRIPGKVGRMKERML